MHTYERTLSLNSCQKIYYLLHTKSNYKFYFIYFSDKTTTFTNRLKAKKLHQLQESKTKERHRLSNLRQGEGYNMISCFKFCLESHTNSYCIFNRQASL